MGVSYTSKFTDFTLTVVKELKQEMLSTATKLHYEVAKGQPSGETGRIPINPQITGRLKESWRINLDGEFFDIGEGFYASNVVTTPPLPKWQDIKDKLYLTNGVPYAEYVELGINPIFINSKAVAKHKKFLKKAIMRVEN